MSKTDDKPAEFFSDEHRSSHVAALVREGDGYDAKVAAAETVGDDVAAKLHASRRAQVDAELKRLGADAKTPRERAASR